MSDNPPDAESPQRLTLAEAFARDAENQRPTQVPTRRRRRRSRSSRKYLPVPFVAGAAAVASTTSGVEPAGWLPADLFWTAALAALVAVGCVPAKRWTWVVLAVTSAVFAEGALWLGLGVLALGIALYAIWQDRREPVLGALVGAISFQSLLHLQDVAGEGSSALVALAAITTVLWSGFKHSRPETRRNVRYAAGALVAASVIATIGLGVGVLLGQSSARTAQKQADSGMRALRQGRPDDADQRLSLAASSFEDAGSAFSGPWTLPARAIPVVGHHAVALSELADHGAAVTTSGAKGARSTDYERLRPIEGQVDIDAIRATQEPYAQIVQTLGDASAASGDVSSPWLLPPLRSVTDEFFSQVDETLPDAEVAAEAVAVAPAMLGADGPRRYLLVFAQPAEARFMGGFIGSYGFLSAVDGKVELEEARSIGELNATPGRENRKITGPPEYLARYGRFRAETFIQNISATPDLPTLNTVATELIPQTGSGEIDGVIYVDPAGLAALLRITGPVEVDGLEEPLTAKNATDLLLREQYELFPPNDRASDTEQEHFLSDAAEVTFDALLSRRLPSPSELADVAGPAARGNHLMASVHDPKGQAFLEMIGGSGSFPADQGVDWFSVRQSNANGNKIDAYLERSVVYDVETDPSTGAVEAKARVTFTNTAPPGPVPGIEAAPEFVLGNINDDPMGTNRTQVAVFSPLELTSSRIDGRSAPVEIQSEFGGSVYSFTLVIPPGGSVVLEIDLRGAIDPGPYRLNVSQPGQANHDDMAITVRPLRGRPVEAAGLKVEGDKAGRSGPLREDLAIEVDSG